jgi:hypothetical protein
MIRQSVLLRICIVCIVAMMAGCKQNSTTPLEPASLSTYQPKGTITGLIVNSITSMPVAGAVITLGYDGNVQSVTSNGAGAYSFANVPVGKYQIVNGAAVFSGIYNFTASLVAYNAGQKDSTKKYRDYYYSNVSITFTSVGLGDSLVASDMVGTSLLQISYLNTTVTGQVVDQNQQPVANATVQLFDATVFPNTLLAQTTTSTSGAYQFSAVDNGLTITIKALSSDGTFAGTLAGFTLPANFPTNLQVNAKRIMIMPLNTTVTGLVVDQNQQPVANATVMLYDATVAPNALIGQTTTSASGVYQFSANANGLTVVIKARSSDGSLQGTLAAFTLPANVVSDSLRSQVNVERLMITPVDNVNPFVISLTPENNSDVPPANLQVVYTFSEPIKQRAYTRTDLPLGSNTIMDAIKVTYVGLKKTATAITFSAQWNAGLTQLTITPQGIVGSAKYSVDLTAAFASGQLTDNANLTVINNPQITGDFEVLQFSTNGASTVPAAPTLARRFVNGLFTSLDFGGGAVGLEWNYDANARSYNIYWSADGGSFQLLQANFVGIQFTSNIASLVYPSAAVNPLRASSVQYLVRAVSKDLVESASSNVITVTDAVKPQLLLTSSVAAAGGANSWTYTLRFTEPLTISTAEAIGNYSFGNTGGVAFSVNSASYLGNVAGAYVVQLGVTTNAALPVGYVVFVSSNVTDLAGNSIDPAANSKTF